MTSSAPWAMTPCVRSSPPGSSTKGVLLKRRGKRCEVSGVNHRDRTCPAVGDAVLEDLWAGITVRDCRSVVRSCDSQRCVPRVDR